MIKKILVSQPKPSSERSPYYDIAERHQVEIVFHPFIQVEGLTAKEFRAQKISLTDFTAIVFTSRHSIDHFFQIAKELRFAVPESMKYFCITEQVALYIQKYVQYRKRKIFFGATGKIADLVPIMAKHKNERYFVPQSDVHNEELRELLDARHLYHTEGVMYRTVSNNFDRNEPFDYDLLVFFSPSGVESLLKNFPDFEQGDMAIATFGPATARSVRDHGMRLDLEAPTPQYPSITAALNAYIGEVNKREAEHQRKQAAAAARKAAAKSSAPKSAATKKSTSDDERN